MFHSFLIIIVLKHYLHYLNVKLKKNGYVNNRTAVKFAVDDLCFRVHPRIR